MKAQAVEIPTLFSQIKDCLTAGSLAAQGLQVFTKLLFCDA
nr:MAG TPA: hypothetical protein [Caudoviricetes sp.]